LTSRTLVYYFFTMLSSRRCFVLALLGSFCFCLSLLPQQAFGFAATADTASVNKSPFAEAKPENALQTKDVVTKVAVAGATGRTGQFVVQELLARGVPNVVAVVRDQTKFEKVFADAPDNLQCVQCDLGNPKAIESAVEGCDAAIWCATGFSDNPETDWIEKVKRLVGMAVKGSKTSIDAVGLPALANAVGTKNEVVNGGVQLPKVVMCSSAGVTRTIWSEEKKERFQGAADIPIVRLNPFGILDRKRESEEELRNSITNYCIVRPCGLNDDWPAGSRPLFSQGDVAVGRINRKDVASILVDVLSTPEATGKTFEVVGVAGYPKPVSLGPALERLYKDDGEPPSNAEAVLFATYTTMQQLLPGEKQDAAALAMGQTYEQLDKDETGRLGERGKENAEAAAPKPSS